jgi:hypothetical protein
MATIIVLKRAMRYAGTYRAADSEVSVSADEALAAVTRGIASYKTAPTTAPDGYTVFTSGTWTATAASATGNISVPGLKESDVVVGALAAQGAAETFVKIVNDHENSRAVVTLGAAASAGTTKVSYTVFRKQ